MAICFEVERVPSRRPARSPERARVAEVLRELRPKLGLSQEKFAPLVGLTHEGYRPYERGERVISPEQLPVFAEALKITRSELSHRLGLGPLEVHSAFGAEVAELMQRVPEQEVRDELKEAIRAMLRVGGRGSPPRSES